MAHFLSTYYLPILNIYLYLLHTYTYYLPIPITYLYLLPTYTYNLPIPITYLYLLPAYTYYLPIPITYLDLLPAYTYYLPLPITYLYLLPAYTYYLPIPTFEKYSITAHHKSQIIERQKVFINWGTIGGSIIRKSEPQRCELLAAKASRSVEIFFWSIDDNYIAFVRSRRQIWYMGCRHSSVDSSTPSILPPRLWVPSTPSTLLSFYILKGFM